MVAEKLEAIVSLGMANSRMKDYYDLRALAHEGALNTGELAQAFAATFARRQTQLPDGLPLGLGDEFAQDAAKQTQWKAFLNKNRLDAPGLDAVIVDIRKLVEVPLRLAKEIVARG